MPGATVHSMQYLHEYDATFQCDIAGNDGSFVLDAEGRGEDV